MTVDSIDSATKGQRKDYLLDEIKIIQVEEFIEIEGFSIFTKTWLPNRTPKATIHGFGEHVSRSGYSSLFETLCKHGIKVHAYDQLGFGKTVKKNGHIGHNEGWDRIFLDIKKANKRTRIPNTPHFLFGHSMGGGIVLRYAIENGSEIDGVIATSPLVNFGGDLSGGINPFLKFTVHLLSGFFPRLSLPKKRGDQDPNVRCTKDPKYIKEGLNDPLLNSSLTLTTFSSFLHNTDFLIGEGPGHLTVPVLISHGKLDNVTCPESSREFFDKVDEKVDKEYHLFNDGWHELHHEYDSEKITMTYVNWLLQRIEK